MCGEYVYGLDAVAQIQHLKEERDSWIRKLESAVEEQDSTYLAEINALKLENAQLKAQLSAYFRPSKPNTANSEQQNRAAPQSSHDSRKRVARSNSKGQLREPTSNLVWLHILVCVLPLRKYTYTCIYERLQVLHSLETGSTIYTHSQTRGRGKNKSCKDVEYCSC